MIHEKEGLRQIHVFNRPRALLECLKFELNVFLIYFFSKKNIKIRLSSYELPGEQLIKKESGK